MTRRAGLRSRSELATGFAAPAIALEARDYSRTGPWGPIVEKRRLASYNEALFIITTSPLLLPTRVRPPTPSDILPSGDSWYPTATLANRRPLWAWFARAVRCYRLYGDIVDKFAPDRNCLAR